MAGAAPLDEAQQLIKSGQHAKALELVERQLKNQPKDIQARFLKGVALLGLNRASEAEAIFKKLTEEQPTLPEPYNNLAVIYAQQKQYEKAREALEAAIRTHPAYATAHENLGDIYARLASQAYGKALQLDSANVTAQAKLAMINELIGGKASASSPPPKSVAEKSPPKAEPATPPTVEAKLPDGKAVEPKTTDARPAETKPSEAPATAAKSAAASVEGEVTAFVDAWLAAWSRKDVKAYFAHYGADFATPKGMSRKEWESERTQRLTKPGPIVVRREQLSIDSQGPDRVTVRFRQHYQSTGFKASSTKTLVLVKRNGAWQIVKETAG